MGSAQSAVGWARHGVTEPAGPTAPGGGGLSRWSPAASGFASRGHSRDGRAQKRGRAPWVSNSAQASLSSMKIIRACCSYGCPAACGSSGEGGWCLRPARPRPAPRAPAWHSPCPGGRPARPGDTASSPARASPGRPCPRESSGSRRPTARCATWTAGRGCSSPCPRSTPGAAGQAGAADQGPSRSPAPTLAC